MATGNCTPLLCGPAAPPAVLDKFRREDVYPRPRTPFVRFAAPPTGYGGVIEVPCRTVSETPAVEADLEAGQRRLRELLAREEEIRSYPGVTPTTPTQVATICINDSGLIDTLAVKKALLREMRAGLLFAPDAPKEADVCLAIKATAELEGTRHQLSAVIFGEQLHRYKRTLVPDDGIKAAYALRRAADLLIVIDPVHAHWTYSRRDITPPRDRDPLLLALTFPPYRGVPGREKKDANLFLLCQWK